MVRSLAACSTIKSCGIFCAISTTLIPFSVLSVSIWKRCTLDLLTVNLCIVPRRCKKMLPALSSPKVDPTLSSDKRLVLEHHETHTPSHNVCTLLALSKAPLNTIIPKLSLNEDIAINTNLFITYTAHEHPYYQTDKASKLTLPPNRPPNPRKSPRIPPHLPNIRSRLHTNRPPQNLERSLLLYVPQSPSFFPSF